MGILGAGSFTNRGKRMMDANFILAGTLLTSASEPVLNDRLIRIRGNLVESVEQLPHTCTDDIQSRCLTMAEDREQGIVYPENGGRVDTVLVSGPKLEIVRRLRLGHSWRPTSIASTMRP